MADVVSLPQRQPPGKLGKLRETVFKTYLSNNQILSREKTAQIFYQVVVDYRTPRVSPSSRKSIVRSLLPYGAQVNPLNIKSQAFH